ncbi:leucine-rich repeat and WD repeat-containing protein [Elysia marginata]|uniref:Leucine-rich repeat and WD repeat-containing protein n=1 Tax=Elysia marginata TaxID=1093978 RepID=A0AAV4FEE2_9GAST|nr:leucine-rich repeat and WD repeat-containing protein [Elysia marginata]
MGCGSSNQAPPDRVTDHDKNIALVQTAAGTTSKSKQENYNENQGNQDKKAQEAPPKESSKEPPPQVEQSNTQPPPDVGPSTAGQQPEAVKQPVTVSTENKPKLDLSGLDDLKKMADDLKTKITDQLQDQRKQFVDSVTLPVTISKIIKGDLSVRCPAEARVVRIFVSSTFTGHIIIITTIILIIIILIIIIIIIIIITSSSSSSSSSSPSPPPLYLQPFSRPSPQVVDMRWGIRDEAQDDHMTTDICLKEVQLCKEQSTGPCFVVSCSLRLI